MHRSSDLIDEPSRLKQFAWEQWDDQIIAVIFRPAHYGLDRYVVKRYVEQVFSQSNQWKDLSSYFPHISPKISSYSLTSSEIELMRKILDYHINNKFRIRLTLTNDELISYDQLLDFLTQAKEFQTKNSKNHHLITGKIISIPTIHSPFILPTKTPSPIPSTSNSEQISIPSEFCPISLYNAKIDGNGWIQINNVYLPFIIKNQQRLVPYQVLVSCKILQSDQLRSTLIRSTTSDIQLINSMIKNCKINSEEIPLTTLLINVYHILIGTNNIIYCKILSNDNPILKINRQYKNVLKLNGGFIDLNNNNLIPFVSSSNHSYISLKHILNIYPNYKTDFQNISRVPHTNELDYLQLIQIYLNNNQIPLETLLIDIDELKKKDIIPKKIQTLFEYHQIEKFKFEQQIISLKNSFSNKRKNFQSHENKQIQQKFKSSTSSNQFQPSGYYPPPSQQNYCLQTNNGHRGRTRWQ